MSGVVFLNEKDLGSVTIDDKQKILSISIKELKMFIINTQSFCLSEQSPGFFFSCQSDCFPFSYMLLLSE